MSYCVSGRKRAPLPSEVHLAGLQTGLKRDEAAPARFQPLGKFEADGYVFEQALGLVVSRGGRQLLRVDGGEFFSPGAGSGGCEFSVDSRRYIVLGERHPGRKYEGAWHVVQVRPRLLYVQRIKAIPDTGCPLLLLDGSGPELAVDDATLCGFDGDEDCSLSFTVWYTFRAYFRPDYSLGYEVPGEDYLDELMWDEDWLDLKEGRLAAPGYWGAVLNLLVGGQAKVANEFLDRTFPGDETDRRRAVSAFLKRFRASRHYPGILQLNHGEMVH
jgi:hypothetical protein